MSSPKKWKKTGVSQWPGSTEYHYHESPSTHGPYPFKLQKKMRHKKPLYEYNISQMRKRTPQKAQTLNVWYDFTTFTIEIDQI